MGAVYAIDFPNGKRYLGMTEASADVRWRDHKYHARAGHKGVVYEALRKHGIENAKFSVLVLAEGRAYLSELEQRAIAVFGTRAPAGYNLTDGGDGAPKGHNYRIGMKHTREAKAKMAAAKLGVRRSEEVKRRISASLIGNKRSLGHRQSDEVRQKRALAMRGRTFSKESIEKMRAAALKREAERRAQGEAA